METVEHKNRINLLPEHLIDQIKAGEVVERPANVLKELLENSIDSKPTEIKITIKENGLDLIAIEDDGKGMFFDELPYAFCRHATSKILSFEDIYRLNTFGFRGEALASISSVSRISCHSAPKEDILSGGKIVINGAQTIEHSVYRPNKHGTSIYVKDLFYNTPVRLKFIKSKTSEKNALKRIINAFLITNPHIKFSVVFDDDDREIYPAVEKEDRIKRIAQIISTRTRKVTLVEETNSYLKNSVKIYTSLESTKGYTGKHHYLFVNGRLFTDKKLQQIVVRNLEKLWSFGETGHFVVELNVAENEIDVNVHPNKTLIKFLNENEVFSLVSASLKNIVKKNQESKSIEHTQETMLPDNASPFETLMSSPLWERASSDESRFQGTSVEIGQRSLFSEQVDNKIIPAGNNIFILESVESGLYLLNAEIALKNELVKIEAKDEKDLTPLLISEPFNIVATETEQKHLERLENIGIEIDRIDHTTLVLRTIPSLIESYNYIQIVDEVLRTLLKDKNIEDVNFSQIILDKELMADLFKKNGLIELIKCSVAKKLTGKDLRSKFYGSK